MGNASQAALPSGFVSFVTTGTGTATRHGPDNPIAWDSYVFNVETLQYAVRFRWYDPGFGRWLERDPLGSIDGLNMYEGVVGNPIRFVDPLELDADSPKPKTDDSCCWKKILPCGYVPKFTDDYHDALTRQGGRVRIVRYFRNKDGSLRKSDPVDPCADEEMDVLNKETSDHVAGRTVNDAARGTEAVLATTVMIGGVIVSIYSPIDELSIAAYGALRGLKLAKTAAGTLKKIVNGNHVDLTEAELKAAESAQRAGHLTRIPLRDGMRVTRTTADDLMEEFLGPGYERVKDGLRQVRHDVDCDAPHYNFEVREADPTRPGRWRHTSNDHIYID